MGSLRFAAVLFCIYSHDHPPPHVHATYGGIEVILDLLPEGNIEVSSRAEPVKPRNAKLGDIRRILRVARMHETELRELWRQTHGTSHDR